MTSNKAVAKKLIEILKLVPEKKGLEIASSKKVKLLANKEVLLHVSPEEIKLPHISFPIFPVSKISPLKNSFVPSSQIKSLFSFLAENNLFQRLNLLLCLKQKGLLS
jgi:hypothetical protein